MAVDLLAVVIVTSLLRVRLGFGAWRRSLGSVRDLAGRVARWVGRTSRPGCCVCAVHAVVLAAGVCGS